ncbi:MAG TPA: hypothetical protein ENJ82_15800 [Bacteroidetes bacterium]|nr:hypothetical protein [Bacteroidota bacterium]
MEDTLNLVRSFFPGDGGPIYQETPLHFSHWLVEPWNAISSLFILLPGIYFLFKLRGEFKKHLFLAFCLPLLFLGGLGSTFFHAFRISTVFLIMDVAPTALLFLMISGYLWYRVNRNIAYTLLILFGLLAAAFVIHAKFPPGIGVNVSYALRGTVFFLPMVIILVRTQFENAAMILGAVAAFGFALLFRTLDKETVALLPMGSHFLWHVSTGLGGLLVAEYVYRLEQRKLSLG